MSTLHDPEFGAITVRRSKLSRNVRLKMDARGAITISLPMRTPLFFAKQLLHESRSKLRRSLQSLTANRPSYRNGMLIGKSHQLRLVTCDSNDYRHNVNKTVVTVYHPLNPDQQLLQSTIHQATAKALRQQAKIHLPKRVELLARVGDFNFNKLRFSSAGTRWGSCSSQGTISLNIWLMSLPDPLIDYVIIHELCHTKHMNHSKLFWQLVAAYCPDYQHYRNSLREHHPGI